MMATRYLPRTGMMVGLLLLAIASGMAAIQVELNGSSLSFSQQPVQMGGRTMVPLRGIFEALGAQVNWNADTQTIMANKSGTEVQLTIGDRSARVNERTVVLDTPAMILRGTTMVPLRFISEALGAEVKWFEATQTVSITTSGGASVGDVPPYQGAVEPSYTSGPRYGDQGQYGAFSSGELDVLLGPIALYPDPLIAQILPAATYPDQLYEAGDLIRLRGRDSDIDRQNWDVSVRAIAYYPSVLDMMVYKPDWTIAIGQAYVGQPYDVMRSIQRLRARARSYGYLSTNNYQRVYDDTGYIRIIPVQTRYIYVPQYNPQIVYLQRRTSVSSNVITFGLGLLIGSWLNRDLDWQNNRVYYHGWTGGGWIGDSRPHVVTNDNPYVNDSYRQTPIAVDRSVKTRDMGDYRTKIKKSVGTFKVPESRKPSRLDNRQNPNGKDVGPPNDNSGRN